MSSAAPAPVPSTIYRPELDALRFGAFLAVFAAHALPAEEALYQAHRLPPFLATVARAGAFGVDLFFLLSGYLITTLLLRERECRGEIDIRAFYLRRILRIWPLYFFALGIAFAWGFWRPESAMPVPYLLAYLLLAGNWMTALYGPPGSFMSILWSVSIEEQFYLVWPVLLRKVSLRACAAAMIGIAWAVRALLAFRHPHVYTVYPNTFARLDAIAIGILLAGRLFDFRWYMRLSLAAAGLAAWLVSGYCFGTSAAYTLLGYPLMTLGSLLLFLAVLGMNVQEGWLTYLGKISYGLYVYHTLALVAAREWLPHRYAEAVVVGFAATILLAAVSYHFFERPILILKQRFTYVPSRPA